MKKALITGIAGQDGSYLAEYLLNLGYEVHGLIRRNSVPENQESRLDSIADQIQTYYADLTDTTGLCHLIGKIAPSEIYNLGAQSHVRISFEIPQFTTLVNAVGVLNILESIRISGVSARFYQASSSEMFGSSVDPDGFQRETTPMLPVSPYGCAKLYGYHITRNYRESYGLHASNGILFNHESERRGSNFVTSKIVKTAVEIKLGMQSELVLGNLDSYRDWGHSRDYVRAMHSIINNSIPNDYVVSSGIARSIRDFLKIVFDLLQLDYMDYVRQDAKFLRPQELPYLCGDSSKIRKELGWVPVITFEEMIEEMVRFWFNRLAK